MKSCGTLVDGIQAPTCGSLDALIYKYFFFCVNILGTSTVVVFSNGYTGFFLLCYITQWYDTFYCTSVCVYIEIVAPVWNSYANNVGENVVKTHLGCGI
jgi:hypothetical protein